MKSVRILTLAMTAAVCGAFTGCALFPEEEEVLAPPLKAPAAVTYTTTTAELGTIIDSVTTSGTFISTSSYDLSFDKRSGYLSELNVKAGDMVEPGQLLAKLDTDDLELDIRKQELAVERAQIALNAARNAEGATGNSIRLAEIDLELQQIQLDSLQTELAKQSIYAPDSGVVSYLAQTGVGQYVNARSTLIRVADPRSLQVECTGGKVSDFRLDQEVVVEVDGEEYTGKVVMTSADAPSIAMEKGTPFVRIEVQDLPEGDFLGKSASVELIREKKENVLVVPRNVVSMYSGESYVLVLEDGVKKERTIETGIKTVTEIEVVSGLEAGEEIIIK